MSPFILAEPLADPAVISMCADPASVVALATATPSVAAVRVSTSDPELAPLSPEPDELPDSPDPPESPDPVGVSTEDGDPEDPLDDGPSVAFESPLPHADSADSEVTATTAIAQRRNLMVPPLQAYGCH
jgi:hypothetical protein